MMLGIGMLLAGIGSARAMAPFELEPGQSAIPLSAHIAYRHDMQASDGATEAFARALG